MKRKKGGQSGNKNAFGNKGGAPIGNRNASRHGAPRGNRNAVTHGMYSHTGIYAHRPFNYEVLSEPDKELFNEILKDTRYNIEAAENLFRVVKFENNIPKNCNNPIAAMMHSGRIMMEYLNQCNIPLL